MRRALPFGLLMLATTQSTWTQQPRTHDLALAPEHVHWVTTIRVCRRCCRSPRAIASESRRWSRADSSD